MRYSNIDKSSKARTDTQKKYYGNYLGMVIQNNDPSKTGRVKIFIPHIAPSIYEGWNKIASDKHFKFIGKNIDSDVTDIIEDLKLLLPWSGCAAPLAGGNSSGRYNAKQKTGSISDSARLQTTTNDNPISTKYALNPDQIGEKPARIYEVNEFRVNDGFSDTTSYNNGVQDFSLTGTGGQANKVNPYSFNYTPSSYSNRAKGSFSIPNVGSHVWVFFVDGDPNSPVYFASSFGAQDWNGIYDSDSDTHGIDYPGSYENKSDRDLTSYNHNVETYRNKYVISQKGGVVEFVNTDNKEVLKLTHYSGSYKEFNNKSTIELATGNDQKLVLGDQFDTVRGNKNQYVDYDFDRIVRGDSYDKIGTFNKEKIDQWKDLVSVIADIKQLFEIQRCTPGSGDITALFPKTSSAQTQAGTYAPCPVCTSETREKIGLITDTGISSLSNPTITSTSDLVFSGVSPSGEVTTNFAFGLPSGGSTNLLGSGNCPCCGGTGLSPSTQNGIWTPEDKKGLIEELTKANIEELVKIERELGLGGSQITNITKHKIVTIGIAMNEFPSIRVDSKGKIANSEVRILDEGVIVNKKAIPLVEYVHVEDMPGGTYSLNACNKFNVQVGSGGISMKTFGPVDIGGTIMNVGAEQLNIASENEINIYAEKRLNIVSDILTLRQKDGNQVLVDSNLGVSKNVVIGGGMHVEGELSVQHVTAPTEIQETEQVVLYGELVAGKTVTNGSGVAVATADSVKIYAHSHAFKNLPLSLMDNHDDVRKVANRNNNTARVLPQKVENVNKGGGRNQTGESIS